MRPCLRILPPRQLLSDALTATSGKLRRARWSPPLERSKLATMSYSGAYVGTIVSMPLSGWLCDSKYGWPSVFYLCGALGVVWFVLWICLVHSDPRTHPRMSEAELQYITGSLASERVGADASSGSGTTTPLLKEAPGSAVSRPGADPTPWVDIFKSAPVWAIVVGHFCNNWGFYNLLTCLPSYLSNVLNLDITHAGFLAGLPYLCMFLWGNIWAGIVDKLRADGCGSTVFWRKFSQSIGHLIGAAALVVCGYAPSAEHGGQTWCAPPLHLAQLAQASVLSREHRSDSVGAVVRAVVCLCIAVGASGFNLSGFNVNHLDIAPKSGPPVSSPLGICLLVAADEAFCAAGRYAGVLMGITNTVATIPGFAAPQITDMIATANHTTVEGRAQLQDQWCAASRSCPLSLLDSSSSRHGVAVGPALMWRLVRGLRRQEVFFIAAGVYVFGVVVYAILASGTKQPWAENHSVQ